MNLFIANFGFSYSVQCIWYMPETVPADFIEMFFLDPRDNSVREF